MSTTNTTSSFLETLREAGKTFDGNSSPSINLSELGAGQLSEAAKRLMDLNTIYKAQYERLSTVFDCLRENQGLADLFAADFLARLRSSNGSSQSSLVGLSVESMIGALVAAAGRYNDRSNGVGSTKAGDLLALLNMLVDLCVLVQAFNAGGRLDLQEGDRSCPGGICRWDYQPNTGVRRLTGLSADGQQLWQSQNRQYSDLRGELTFYQTGDQLWASGKTQHDDFMLFIPASEASYRVQRVLWTGTQLRFSDNFGVKTPSRTGLASISIPPLSPQPASVFRITSEGSAFLVRQEDEGVCVYTLDRETEPRRFAELKLAGEQPENQNPRHSSFVAVCRGNSNETLLMNVETGELCNTNEVHQTESLELYYTSLGSGSTSRWLVRDRLASLRSSGQSQWSEINSDVGVAEIQCALRSESGTIVILSEPSDVAEESSAQTLHVIDAQTNADSAYSSYQVDTTVQLDSIVELNEGKIGLMVDHITHFRLLTLDRSSGHIEESVGFYQKLNLNGRTTFLYEENGQNRILRTDGTLSQPLPAGRVIDQRSDWAIVQAKSGLFELWNLQSTSGIPTLVMRKEPKFWGEHGNNFLVVPYANKIGMLVPLENLSVTQQ